MHVQTLQCLQPQESSLVLYPSAVKDSEDAAVTSMLADGNIVCLYNSALEQVVVNKYMGDLSYYRPSTTGRQMQRQVQRQQGHASQI